MDMSKLLPLLAPIIEQGVDQLVFPAIKAEIEKIADPILKAALEGMLPVFQVAIDDELKKLLAAA